MPEVLNACDFPLRCEFCDAEIPANTDHECDAPDVLQLRAENAELTRRLEAWKDAWMGINTQLLAASAQSRLALDQISAVAERVSDCGDHCLNACPWCEIRAAIDAARKGEQDAI